MTTLESIDDKTQEEILRRFADEQGIGRTAETIERYRETIEQLLHYLEELDPRSSLDADSAARLDRARSEGGSFLSVLGFDSLVQVLPGFLEDPWLPPQGLRRAGHRSLVDRLLTFLRREGLIDVDAHRLEYRAAKSAVRDARSRDYSHSYGNGDPWADTSPNVRWRAEPEVQVVISLPADLLEHVTAGIRSGEHSDASSVVTAALRRDQWNSPWSASMQAWGR